LAEINRDPKKKKDSFKIEDFMPKFVKHTEQSPEVMKKQAMLITRMLGGKVI